MTPSELLLTSGLLGLFALFGGLYGLLYTASMLFGAAAARTAAYACYGAHALCTVAIVGWTPLLWGWKILIIVSAVGYYFVPPATLRYLRRLHGPSGDHQ